MSKVKPYLEYSDFGQDHGLETYPLIGKQCVLSYFLIWYPNLLLLATQRNYFLFILPWGLNQEKT